LLTLARSRVTGPTGSAPAAVIPVTVAATSTAVNATGPATRPRRTLLQAASRNLATPALPEGNNSTREPSAAFAAGLSGERG